MYGILIDHPEEGLILWETGGGKDYPKVTGAPINDIFAQVDHSQDEELDVQIEKCGFKLSDVKMVIMGHLHMDHSGGLVQFRGTKTPILVHELELKNAFYSVATGYELGVYMAHYLTFDLNWQTWTVRRCPRNYASAHAWPYPGPVHHAGELIPEWDLDRDDRHVHCQGELRGELATRLLGS
jgi:glyoxylase-like metal-dependent hydrolase (beta-lactamase superfamily II)